MTRLDDPASRQPVRGFNEGVPEWMVPMLRNCSRCGGRLAFGPVHGEDRERHHCTGCGYVTYVNPRLVATTLPVMSSGEVVLIRRAIPPGVGTWAQPGGFLEADETVIQGAVRETLEETCLVVEPTGIVGIYPQPRASVVVVVFTAAIVGGHMQVTPESLDVRAFAIDDIPWDGLGFSTTLWAMRDWVRSVRPEFEVESLGSEQLDF
jgi:ADP-ribose pyrophosphatase YjhB (NUDIX family)